MLATADIAIRREYYYTEENYGEAYPFYRNRIEIACQRQAFHALVPLNTLSKPQNDQSTRVYWAFRAVLGPEFKCLYTVTSSTGSVDMSPGWRKRLVDMIERGGVDANNQGVRADASDHFTMWKGLRFRSKVETRIAEALERRAVLYFPLPAARLGTRNERQTREPDFLVCHNGRWGILEVDGPWHTGRPADDHSRDRLFRNHCLQVTEHYNADECFENADKVVDGFLNILKDSR